MAIIPYLNYRPISILPALSTIFEEGMAMRLRNYLGKHKLLTPCQYGFRPGYSTELAVHHLCQSMYHAMDSKLYQITVLLLLLLLLLLLSFVVVVVAITFNYHYYYQYFVLPAIPSFFL